MLELRGTVPGLPRCPHLKPTMSAARLRLGNIINYLGLQNAQSLLLFSFPAINISCSKEMEDEYDYSR